MSKSVCCYCSSDTFTEWKVNESGTIHNQCKSCGCWSAYNETDETQTELPEPKKTTGEF